MLNRLKFHAHGVRKQCHEAISKNIYQIALLYARGIKEQFTHDLVCIFAVIPLYSEFICATQLKRCDMEKHSKNASGNSHDG